MPNLKVHFSSKKNDWETPQDLFDKLNEEFLFTRDVCATASNTKCKFYYSPDDNGLTLGWNGTCWMNPPYGKEIKNWIKKASDESEKGCTVVALLPARTDTSYFHDFIYHKSNVEIRFLRGRLKFVGAEHCAPFPSMIVVFYPK